MIKGWPAIALGLLASVAIIAGLILTGGPGEARKERRDRERDSDLAALAGLVRCLADDNGNRLPDRLAVTARCDRQVRLADPFTGAAYIYQATGPRSYRLCAGFELPQQRPRGSRDRDEGGCVSREYIPAGRTTPGAEATIPYRDPNPP